MAKKGKKYYIRETIVGIVEKFGYIINESDDGWLSAVKIEN